MCLIVAFEHLVCIWTSTGKNLWWPFAFQNILLFLCLSDFLAVGCHDAVMIQSDCENIKELQELSQWWLLEITRAALVDTREYGSNQNEITYYDANQTALIELRDSVIPETIILRMIPRSWDNSSLVFCINRESTTIGEQQIIKENDKL